MEETKGGRLKYEVRIVDGDEYADELMKMQRACFPEDDPVRINGIGEWWMAFLDDAPAAFASMRASTASPLTGYLSRAGVLPGHRGAGLQRRLILARERYARRVGWLWTITNTHRENFYSSNNLIRCGYRMYFPKSDWASKSSNYWVKYLGAPGTEDKSKAPK